MDIQDSQDSPVPAETAITAPSASTHSRRVRQKPNYVVPGPLDIDVWASDSVRPKANCQAKDGLVDPGSQYSAVADDRDDVAADEDEEVTRCVCDQFDENFGVMVQCDQCLVWQHNECIGLLGKRLPKNYYCEQCRPTDHPYFKMLAKQQSKSVSAKLSSDVSSTQKGTNGKKRNRDLPNNGSESNGDTEECQKRQKADTMKNQDASARPPTSKSTSRQKKSASDEPTDKLSSPQQRHPDSILPSPSILSESGAKVSKASSKQKSNCPPSPNSIFNQIVFTGSMGPKPRGLHHRASLSDIKRRINSLATYVAAFEATDFDEVSANLNICTCSSSTEKRTPSDSFSDNSEASTILTPPLSTNSPMQVFGTLKTTIPRIDSLPSSNGSRRESASMECVMCGGLLEGEEEASFCILQRLRRRVEEFKLKFAN